MRARLGKARQPVAIRQCPRNRERDLDYPTQSEGPDCLGSQVGSPDCKSSQAFNPITTLYQHCFTDTAMVSYIQPIFRR
jgi:hypothetical protein